MEVIGTLATDHNNNRYGNNGIAGHGIVIIIRAY